MGDSLEIPATERTIDNLHRVGLLTDVARGEALALLRPEPRWGPWINRTLLVLGAALLLAGVIFFFAFNWQRMSSIAKFCVIEPVLWACAIGAWRTGLGKLTGKVLLLAACVLVGVLMAVYGQVYQTDADAFENYAIWAALILPWVVIARFGALWILWLVVTNTALILFWIQVDAPADFDFVFGLFLLLAFMNGLALTGREYGVHVGWTWLAGRWMRHLIWLSILVYLAIPTIAFIVEPEFGNGSLLGVIALISTLAGGYFYFRRIRPDLLSLGLGLFALCVVVLTLVGKVIFEISDEAWAFLVFGVVVLVVSSAAAYWLRALGEAITDDVHAS